MCSSACTIRVPPTSTSAASMSPLLRAGSGSLLTPSRLSARGGCRSDREFIRVRVSPGREDRAPFSDSSTFETGCHPLPVAFSSHPRRVSHRSGRYLTLYRFRFSENNAPIYFHPVAITPKQLQSCLALPREVLPLLQQYSPLGKGWERC